MPIEEPRLRRAYIDWARGVAVLLMVAWHTVDSWARVADRGSAAFGRVLTLGGFAAPLFLWLAGLVMALSAARKAAAGTSRTVVAEGICRRGLEIFILAFLFRLQAFIISPGNDVVSIFRVDILNVMGIAIFIAGLLWLSGPTARRRAVVFGTLAAAAALLTPIIRTADLVNALPYWWQLYVRPAGDLTTFTLFPWAGFVFAGAACGAILAANRTHEDRHLQLVFAFVGATVAAACWYLSTQPSLYEGSSFWTSSPTWFGIRVGILMIAVAAIYALTTAAESFGVTARPLERFGQSSLFIYWIHVELVYGYASWPLRARLPLWGALAACAVFVVMMYGAISFRDRVAENVRSRQRARTATQTATA